MILDIFSVELATLYINSLIGIAAWIGLRQLSISKTTASNNSKRESVKFASEIVRTYLDDYIAKNSESFAYKNKNDLKSIKLPDEVRLSKFTREEAQQKVPVMILKEAYKVHKDLYKNNRDFCFMLLNEQNSLEAIAAPFVAGVADSETAFKSIGPSFCHSVESLWFDYVFSRYSGDSTQINTLYFANTIELYNSWKSKLEKFDIETRRNKLDEEMEKVVEKEFPLIGAL